VLIAILYAFAGIAVIENPLAASTILTLILAGALIVVGAGGDGRTGGDHRGHISANKTGDPFV